MLTWTMPGEHLSPRGVAVKSGYGVLFPVLLGFPKGLPLRARRDKWGLPEGEHMAGIHRLQNRWSLNSTQPWGMAAMGAMAEPLAIISGSRSQPLSMVDIFNFCRFS